MRTIDIPDDFNGRPPDKRSATGIRHQLTATGRPIGERP
jgi:hypothetical protein